MTIARRKVLAEQASRRWELTAHGSELWKQRAACRGHEPELWFAKGEGMRHGSKVVRALDATARAICSTCPVIGDCLRYAIDLDLRYGTWGGLTELERAKLTGRRPE